MTANEDFQSSVSALGDLEGVWNPFAILETLGMNGKPLFASILPKIIVLGCGLLVLMGLLRLMGALANQMEHPDEDIGLMGLAAEATILAILILFYDPLVMLFPSLFAKIGASLAHLYAADLTAQVSGSLQILGNEKVTDFRFWTGSLSLSMTGLMAAMFSYAALVLVFVMGKLQGYLFTFWYLLGPLALATLLFPPLRRVGAVWFSSLMGTAFMSIIGSLYFLILSKTGWLAKSFSAGFASDFLTCMVFSLLCLLSMSMIPLISLRLWSGIENNIVGAAGGAQKAMGRGAGATAWALQKARSLPSVLSSKASTKPSSPPVGP